MKVQLNENKSYCNCDFKWVVIDESGYSVFGAETEEECLTYIQQYKDM